MTVDIEKYKLLYDFQKEQLAEERQRYTRLEDKSVKYLTSLTFALTAYILLVRWVSKSIFPPEGMLSWIVVVSISLTFLALCSSWSLILRSLQLQDLIKLQTDNTMIEYFKKNKREVVYLELAKKQSKAIAAINVEYEKKLALVRKGYQDIVFSGWCFFVSIVLIFIKIWNV
ncbi:hypothetical protein [Aeromonas dhakensis]|uniref:hypothetical protein n=1 Tax=Aeromonas dhakensis TaxID=196024 RepID=UPI00191EBF72|nr:hypothetical protein [Aeromonas dhakensis]MBL0524111.1 hypothetical protein [Aeromonas dhakensis]HDX8376592.1 hypothetical protein [Aeromonas dhakensis]HDX8401293.1 hypothetical protein [Aeromonas dhakensis]